METFKNRVWVEPVKVGGIGLGSSHRIFISIDLFEKIWASWISNIFITIMNVQDYFQVLKLET